MTTFLVFIGILTILVVAWYKEPRIYLFLFQKLAFRPRDNKAIYMDKDTYFPESRLLESDWVQIKSEFEAVLTESINMLPRFHKLDKANYKISFDTGPAWKTIILKAYNGWFPENCKKFPSTLRITKGVRGISTIMFSILEPGIVIPPHSGKLNGVIRYHLGMKVPVTGKCFITVNGEEYHWREGEGVLFDDTYLHSVRNESEEYRAVLLIDVAKKTTRFIDYLNRFFYRLIIISPMFSKAMKTGRIPTD
jgi:aspartyl/asparaginyl beta-hydroxylase (cupin superfamily)